MDENEIKINLIELLQLTLDFEFMPEKNKSINDLLSTGIDSVNYLRFLSQVEERFNISIKDELWDINKIKTLDELVQYIKTEGESL